MTSSLTSAWTHDPCSYLTLTHARSSFVFGPFPSRQGLEHPHFEPQQWKNEQKDDESLRVAAMTNHFLIRALPSRRHGQSAKHPSAEIRSSGGIGTIEGIART